LIDKREDAQTNPYRPPAAPVEDLGAQNGKLTPTKCTHCGHEFNGVARKTFLGFRKFRCEQCRLEFSSTLFTGHRITYWVLLILAMAVMFGTQEGRPNIFVVLMVIAVSIDAYRLWKLRS
jgi:hypothetical protein